MKEIRIFSVIVFAFFGIVSNSSANSTIHCQSDSMKKNNLDSWEDSIFFNAEAFTIDLTSKTNAILRDQSAGKAQCAVSDTKITCRIEDKTSLLVWDINRLTGVYESFFQTGAKSEGTKVRGICSLLSQRRF